MSIWRFTPNAISLFRLLLIGPVIWSLYSGRFELALILFAIAGISDALDGAMAKRCKWSSNFGAILDPAADKLLIMGTYSTLAVIGVLPWWLLGIVVGRDLVIVLGALFYRWKRGPFSVQPAWTSKINTLFLIVVGVLLVLDGWQRFLSYWSWLLLMIFLTISNILSGLDYVVTWGLRFLRGEESVENLGSSDGPRNI